MLVFVLALLAPDRSAEAQYSPQQAPTIDTIQHVILIWFENREASAITASTAPYFASFAAANVNFTNFYGVTHPSQPNYLNAFSGSNQGVTTNDHFSFPPSIDNLGNQLAAAGKSWRVYVQNFPGNCFDGDSFTGGIDGPGVAGQYVRKHSPAISFENVRVNPAECANIQPLANFDPTVNFAFVVPNMTNDMHDGTTAQGDAFLQAFVPLVTNSPDWTNTLLIVSFDEGTSSVNGGGHIYTAAAAPWLRHADVTSIYNHFSVLRTIEEIFGLPFLNNAATASTMIELLPPLSTPTPSPSVVISGVISYCTDPSLSPVPGVTLGLTGSTTGSALSNGFGQYTLAGLSAGGSYSVIPNKASLAPGATGINTGDVVAVQRHFLDISLLSPGCPAMAADVNGDTSITTADVIAIQRFFLGLTAGTAAVGTYRFNPASRSYTPLSGDQTNENYDAVVLGDVTLSFVH